MYRFFYFAMVKQGRVHGNLVADSWVGAEMQKPLAYMKYGPTDTARCTKARQHSITPFPLVLYLIKVQRPGCFLLQRLFQAACHDSMTLLVRESIVRPKTDQMSQGNLGGQFGPALGATTLGASLFGPMLGIGATLMGAALLGATLPAMLLGAALAAALLGTMLPTPVVPRYVSTK